MMQGRSRILQHREESHLLAFNRSKHCFFASAAAFVLHGLQAALPAPLGGLAAPVFYLDTEGKFSSDVSSNPCWERQPTSILMQFLGTARMANLTAVDEYSNWLLSRTNHSPHCVTQHPRRQCSRQPQ